MSSRLNAAFTIDLEDAAANSDVSTFYLSSYGVTFSTSASGAVFAAPSGGNNVFGYSDGGIDTHWGRTSSPALLASFTTLVSSVAIDFHAQADVTMEAFGSSGSLGVVSFPVVGDATGTLIYNAGTPQISSVQVSIAPQSGADFGQLDNLTVSAVPEPSSLLCVALCGIVWGGRCHLVSRRRQEGSADQKAG
ncbi:MAG: hypothetical protein KDB23_14945 [Planctomycetales bacterium]|nr:hypothetical protein [Planctomycetales bacterium]